MADNLVNLNPESWTIPNIICRQAISRPDEAAIEFIGSDQWTFSDCKIHARKTAGFLRSQGISDSNTVALMTDDPQLFCRCWLGLSFLGATMVAINTSMRGVPLKHQLDIASVDFIIVDEPHDKTISDLTHQATTIVADNILITQAPPLNDTEICRPSHTDTSCIMFTSGTSGPSKGVEMPHAHCVLFAIGTIENYQLTSDDCFYICLPLFHANGLFMQLLASIMCGCRAVIRGRFSASRWLQDIRTTSATHTNMLGAVASFIVAQPPTQHDKDHKLQVIGAAPLPSAAEAQFRNRFGVPGVLPLYGMTEINIPLYGGLTESAPGTCGRLYDKYFEAEIRDPDTDTAVKDGDIGEIMVRPKQPWGFMSGYIGMPERTIEAWRNFWFHTGDAGYINDQQQFVFVDRIKDCIRRRGENISSYEVEQAFLAFDIVAEAAAYAVAADGGEGMEDEVMVALQLAAPADHSNILQLRENAADNLAVFAVPRYLRVVSSLPKTPTGKIRKVVLRQEGLTNDTVDAEQS